MMAHNNCILYINTKTPYDGSGGLDPKRHRVAGVGAESTTPADYVWTLGVSP